ncbi:uncharacterized protein KIAA2013 homolog [Neocloeon triangulifer]|uniref:uncharacterized protein KIAA2013 homolog n=1 Tax=Neocloeon triangulifer TaxID=2078957 RepID=UPI00286EBD51|nr:uncharacterized protein KIAA2013 homolog [Neocloeon triangulifer]
MEFTEWLRRLKRSLDNYFTYRRLFVLVLVVCGLVLYSLPEFLRRFAYSEEEGTAQTCLKDRLTAFTLDIAEYNAHLQHDPQHEGEKTYVPYLGNGHFGLEASPDGNVYLKNGRTLSLPIKCLPVVDTQLSSSQWEEATVIQYVTGMVHKLQCASSGVHTTHQMYAHRSLPSIFVQSIQITNPSDFPATITFRQRGVRNWASADSHKINLPLASKKSQSFTVASAMVDVPKSNLDHVIAVTTVLQAVPELVEVNAHSSATFEFLTSINYSEPVSRSEFVAKKRETEQRAVDAMKQAQSQRSHLLESHISTWRQLWSMGFSISQSLAAESINGDQINATMYYVMSQTPYIPTLQRSELQRVLLYSEGCYGGLHTLQAQNLWTPLSTLNDVNSAVSLWLLTLEKQGCHNLLKAGASGVAEAMVLSFGGLRFSNQHLEFNIHPKYLHRDFHFRRVSYGNLTHVNISVVVQEDNKAVLLVSLDRSDKNYYACDAGCLDTPVQLGPEFKTFPVKLTEPLTSILYITYDKQHMEELRHTIHVQEINEAPAHEHHIIALHKHGHHLGGLPTLFWVSISFLIVVFHMFLIKLIYNEYCGSQDRYRVRYNKP